MFEYFRPGASVVYCHVDHGCKLAASNMFANNGIARANNDTFYVASSMAGKLNILERQADDTLVLTDVIPTGEEKHGYVGYHMHNLSSDRILDNVSVDKDGVVWAAGKPYFPSYNRYPNANSRY